jgi:hypothetical protein
MTDKFSFTVENVQMAFEACYEALYQAKPRNKDIKKIPSLFQAYGKNGKDNRLKLPLGSDNTVLVAEAYIGVIGKINTPREWCSYYIAPGHDTKVSTVKKLEEALKEKGFKVLEYKLASGLFQ